jgi:hypothetical protein
MKDGTFCDEFGGDTQGMLRPWPWFQLHTSPLSSYPLV